MKNPFRNFMQKSEVTGFSNAEEARKVQDKQLELARQLIVEAMCIHTDILIRERIERSSPTKQKILNIYNECLNESFLVILRRLIKKQHLPKFSIITPEDLIRTEMYQEISKYFIAKGYETQIKDNSLSLSNMTLSIMWRE